MLNALSSIYSQHVLAVSAFWQVPHRSQTYTHKLFKPCCHDNCCHIHQNRGLRYLSNTRRWADVALMLGQRWRLWLALVWYLLCNIPLANKHGAALGCDQYINVVSITGYRLLRWPNIKTTLQRYKTTVHWPALVQYFIFTVVFPSTSKRKALTQCCFNDGPLSDTLAQQ